MVKEIMSRLVKGMFLLARLYLHSLEHETSERDVKDALERLKDRAKHNTNPKFNIVDQAYSDTLKRLREQNQKHCDLAFRVITWICCTGWRLPVDAVQHGLALREGDTMFHEDGMVDQQLMLSVCWGLVEISKGSGELRLVHYTTKDFFRHNLHMLDEYFLTRHSLNCHLPSSTDAYLARQCLTCLSIGLPRQRSGAIGKDSQPRFRSCDAFKPSRLARLHLRQGSSLEQHDYETLVDEIKRDPLYEYSAFNFVGHLKRLPRFDQTYINSIALLRRRGMFDQAVLVVLALGYLGDRKRGKIQVPKELSPCHLAALFGLIDLAKSQMERPNLDAIDDCGSADLVWAMECLTFEFSFDVEIDMHCRCSALYPDIDLDRRHVVKALIASGANPHMLGYEGNTPLHLAAISGDEDIIKMLLDRGADISTSNEYGHIPLVLAVRYRRETAYMKLLELGTVDMCGENHRTALIEAASVGDLTLVKTLVQRGATVDFLDETGQTALMEASRGRNPQIVKLLLEKKSDVNLKDHNCDTAIIKACIGGDPSVIELLLEANAQLEFTNAARETVLSNVGRSCGEGIIKRLLRHSTDPATRDRHSGYVLASASKNGRLDIVSSILEDAAFKPALEHLNLALSNSCSAGNEKVVKLLIDHGASPNTNLELMEWPETLLTRAIREGDDAIVLLLLDAGINCENENKAEIGPIHAAASTGTKLMVQSLIDKGFSVNHRASIGRMPLDFAMRREDKDTSIADFLRERGAITEVERLVRFMRNRRKKVD